MRGWFAARQRRAALTRRRDCDPPGPGDRSSRESLTQDSRSAVKARLFDPLRESVGEKRCASRVDGRDGLREAITQFGALGHATECRVEAETVALRAYVTSGCPASARRARCARVRATTSRHVVQRACGPRTSGAKVSHSTRRRWAAISGVGAWVKAGGACDALQGRGGAGANAQGSG